jgi:hypothetical protein
VATANNRRSVDTAAQIITARYPGKCSETGRTIRPGESVLWFPATRAVYGIDTATYDAWLDGQDVPAADGPSFDRFDSEWEDRCRDACGL